MADEIRQFSPVLPAGTPSAAPVTLDMTMPPRIVTRMEIVVPPGGSGLIGFYIGLGGQRIIPYGSDPFIVAADEKMIWDLNNYPDSGDWTLTGYNTGLLDHAVYVRFLLDVPQLHPLTVQTPAIDPDEISGAVDLAPAQTGT